MEMSGIAFALLIVLTNCLASSQGLPSHHQGKNDKYDRREMVGKTDKSATANNQAVRSSRDIKVPRIVGGKALRPHEWPFLVQVGFLSSHDHYIIYCGGTIIDQYHVVTAAHCLKGDRPYYIVAGVHKDDRVEDSQQTIWVDKAFRHPDYDNDEHSSDVAVLRLSNPLSWTKAVNWTNLNMDESCPSHHAMCRVAGWGRVTEEGEYSNVPLMVEVRVRSNRTCSKAYDHYYHDIELCAGMGEKDACKGDSGGPFMCHCGDKGEGVLTGIVSYGHGCARAKFPGVYTRVSFFYDFIYNIITGSSD